MCHPVSEAGWREVAAVGDVTRVDVDEVKATTAKAVLVDVGGDEEWVPRSVIVEPEDGEGLERGDGDLDLYLLRWFADKKGWR